MQLPPLRERKDLIPRAELRLAASERIPAKGIGLLIAVDAIPDVFATIGNVTGDMAAAAIVSRGQPANIPPADAAGL